jgi:hypothetical protein
MMRHVRRTEAMLLVKDVDYISKRALVHDVQASYNGLDRLPLGRSGAMRLGSFGHGWDDRGMLGMA